MWEGERVDDGFFEFFYYAFETTDICDVNCQCRSELGVAISQS